MRDPLGDGWTYRKKPEADGRPIEFWIDGCPHQGEERGAPIADVYAASTKVGSLHRARLISACPTMLDALDGIWHSLKHANINEPWIERIRAYTSEGIERATGRVPL